MPRARTLPSSPTLAGVLFMVHGLAHSALGIWASGVGPAWVVIPLWWLAEVGFLASGAGVLGVPWLRRIWEPLALIAALSSMLLLALVGHLLFTAGLLIDVVIVVAGLRWGESTLLPARARRTPGAAARRNTRGRVAGTLLAALVLYVAIVIPLRPTFIQWGTSREDRFVPLPGDGFVSDAHYHIDHAVTINAPADSVWPWLVQIGQDRAGFYSYDWMERLIGADIHNADRVHVEWQVRQAGDVVPATQPDYLGGRLGMRPGWQVLDVTPGRALVLQGWGAFVLRPVDARTTRLQVRTRGEGDPTIRGVILGPLTLLVFEPAHWIMERRMLLGIKARAEHAV